MELLRRNVHACSDTSDGEDGNIPLDVQSLSLDVQSLNLDAADAGPRTNSDDDSNNQDLEPFWEKLNAARSRAMERMRFSSWDLPDQADKRPPSTINQVVVYFT